MGTKNECVAPEDAVEGLTFPVCSAELVEVDGWGIAATDDGKVGVGGSVRVILDRSIRSKRSARALFAAFSDAVCSANIDDRWFIDCSKAARVRLDIAWGCGLGATPIRSRSFARREV